jgi:DGQHR domain-containing protein
MTDVRIPVFSVRQPIGEFYVGVIRADELLRICEFDYRRMHYTGGYIDFLGIQRELDKKRVGEISAYVKTIDACFPTSIVISIDEKCARIEETERQGFDILHIFGYEDPETPELSIPLDQVATIIDGQHRLKGLQEAKHLEFEVSLSIFVGVDDATDASLFSTVNLSQTKVNKSLVYDLFSLAKTRSPEKTCHEIVVNLDRLTDSPFQGRIKRLGVATKGRLAETLSQATIVKGLLPYISNDPLLDRDIGKRFGFWEPALARDVTRRIFYEFFRRKEDEKILQNVINYFNAVKNRWPTAWARTGTGNIINRTNGFNGFVRFLRPAYLYWTTTPAVVTEGQFRQILDRVRLEDDSFNPNEFVPGSSGESKLYRKLMEDSGLGTQ